MSPRFAFTCVIVPVDWVSFGVLFSNLLSLKALDSFRPTTFQLALREGQIPTLDPLQVSLGN